jgi:prepilin-type processing-associated H-X9-DG protein
MKHSLHQSDGPALRGHAFTLVEILAALSVIILLAILMMPTVNRTLESGRRTRCTANLRQIGLALQDYSRDHDQQFPYTYYPTNTWDGLLVKEGYATPQVFACPSDKIKRTRPGDIRSYAYNGYFGGYYLENNPHSLRGGLIRLNKPLSDLILVADRGGVTAVINYPDYSSAYTSKDCHGTHKNGANYLFADLHVEWMKESGDSQFSSNAPLFWKHWRTD